MMNTTTSLETLVPGPITITPISFVQLGQTTISSSAYQCDWVRNNSDICPAVLNCWYALKLHYFLCHIAPRNSSSMHCYIKKCNMSKQSKQTVTSLQTHVHDVHMVRVGAPCPISGCISKNLYSSEALVVHLNNQHASLCGKLVQYPSDMFNPSWTPRPPTIELKAFSAKSLILSGTAGGQLKPGQLQALVTLSPNVLPANHSAPVDEELALFGQKHLPRQISPARKKAPEPPKPGPSADNFSFPNLPRYSDSGPGKHGSLLVWCSQKCPVMKLSRPQPMLSPISETKDSPGTHYIRFSKMINMQ